MHGTGLMRLLGVEASRTKRSRVQKAFPLPRTLVPLSSGVDISDSSVKILTLAPAHRGFVVGSFATGALAQGIVVDGIVRDPVALGKTLRELVASARAPKVAHVALPEEAAYVFTMHVPDARDRSQVRTMIEFEFEGRVPLKPSATVYDYDIISAHTDNVGVEIAVSVFPREVVEGYIAACASGGLRPASLEIEARSIARAIVPQEDADAATMVIDFGRARTGIAILKGSVPIFTTTVPVGGNAITKILVEQMKVDEEKAEEYKNEQGLVPGTDAKIAEMIAGTAAALSDEIARHFEYWDARRDEHGQRVTPIHSVLLTGGSSNLRGLPEYIATRVKAPARRADVWGNVCSYEDYIPSIDEHHALGLSTVIGLALRGM